METISARMSPTSCPYIVIGRIIGSLKPDNSDMFSSHKLCTKLDYRVRKGWTVDIEFTTDAGAILKGTITVDNERNLSVKIIPIKKISKGHFDLVMETFRDTVKKQTNLSWKFHRERIEKGKRKPNPFPFNPVPC